MVRHRDLAPPALAAVPRPAEAREGAHARTTSGLPDLDALISGGFPAERTVLVCGRPGTGKTTFGLQFLLDGLDRGQAAALVSADEKPRHLIDDSIRFGWDLTPAIEKGALTLLDAAPFFTATAGRNGSHPGIDVREVAADLVQEVSRVGARRLVIDSITSLIPPGLTPMEVHAYLRSLICSLEDNASCTTLLTCRAARGRDVQGGCEAARSLASGVLELRLVRQGPEIARTLRLWKMRGGPAEPADYAFTLEPGWGLSLMERTRAGVLATASNL